MYWYKLCPACRQGRLFVYRDTTNKRLYLHCEECETGFESPSHADNAGPGFSTLTEDFHAVEASMSDIHEMGWADYEFQESSD